MAKMARKISGPKKELKATIEKAKKAKKTTLPSSKDLKKYAKAEKDAEMKNFREKTVTNPSHQKDLARMSGATAAKAASLKQQERYAKGKPMKLSKIGAAGAKAERRTLKSFK